MSKPNEFLTKYRIYDTIEFYELYLNINNYTSEAQDAFEIVLEERGGVEKLESDIQTINAKNKEIKLIKNRVFEINSKNKTVDQIFNQVFSDILTKEEILEIILAEKREEEAITKDENVNSKTIIGSIIGCAVGAIMAGLYLGIILAKLTKIPVFLFIPIPFICYGCIWIFTRQSKNNAVVASFTGASVILAIIIGIAYRGFFY